MNFFTAAQAIKEIEKAFLRFNEMEGFPIHRDPEKFIEELQIFLDNQDIAAWDRDYFNSLLVLYRQSLFCRRMARARMTNRGVAIVDMNQL